LDILVVDDAAVMRAAIKGVLTGRCRVPSSSVHEASDGRQAVMRYKDVRPGLVFMDVTMPGMGGIEATKEILNFDPDAKIIMCTASSHKTNVVSSLVSGAIDYIVKPPDPERIVQAFEEIIGKVASDSEINAMKKAEEAAVREEEMKKAAIAESESGLAAQMATREAKQAAKNAEEGLAHKILEDSKGK